jgi:hypothetical protein
LLHGNVTQPLPWAVGGGLEIEQRLQLRYPIGVKQMSNVSVDQP